MKSVTATSWPTSAFSSSGLPMIRCVISTSFGLIKAACAFANNSVTHFHREGAKDAKKTPRRLVAASPPQVLSWFFGDNFPVLPNNDRSAVHSCCFSCASRGQTDGSGDRFKETLVLFSCFVRLHGLVSISSGSPRELSSMCSLEGIGMDSTALNGAR